MPELSVSNIETSKHFYLDVLGFKLEYERKEDNFVFISYGEAQIMLEQINGNWDTGTLERPFGRGVNFQIKTDNVEEISKNILFAGFQLFEDIYQVSYMENETLHSLKEFLVQDPDGYLLRFSQSL